MVEQGFALASHFACKLPEITARFDEPVGKASFTPRARARSRQTATYPFRLDGNLADQPQDRGAHKRVRAGRGPGPTAHVLEPCPTIAPRKPGPQTELTPICTSRIPSGLSPP